MPFVHYNTSPRPSRKTTPREHPTKSCDVAGTPPPSARQTARKAQLWPEAGSIPMLFEHAHTTASQDPEP